MPEEKTFIRECYPFGKCDTYRLANGTLEYHYSAGEVFTDVRELAQALERDWRPVAYDDLLWYRRYIVPLLK